MCQLSIIDGGCL